MSLYSQCYTVRMKEDMFTGPRPRTHSGGEEADQHIVKKELPKDTTIEPKEKEGLVKGFSPEDEIKKILVLPSADRKEALSSWKEKYAEQRIGIAKLQADIINHVRAHPDATKQDLIDIFSQADLKFHFDQEQKELAEAVIDVYQERHEMMIKAKEPYSDDTEFFKAVFGVSPIGTVVCEVWPVSYHFKCNNPIDFARIRNFNKGGLATLRSLLGRVTGINQIGGGTWSEVLIPELAGAVTAEDTSLTMSGYGNAIRVHEEQHVFRRLIDDAINRTDADQESARENVLRQTTNEDDLMQECKAIIQDRIEDEILAHKKGRVGEVETRNSMRKLYIPEYVKAEVSRLQEQFAELYKEFEHGQPTSRKESIEQAKKSIHNVIKNLKSREFDSEMQDAGNSAQSAYMGLKNHLKLSDEEITALLDYEPLDQWVKLRNRLVDQKKREVGNTG